MDRADLDEPFQAIVERIASGGMLHGHRALVGGVSARVDAVEYRLPDATVQQFVVRRHGAADWKPLEPGVTANEYELLAALHAANVPVPEPLLLDLSGELLPTPYLVMEMVAGTTAVEANWRDRALVQMADFLLSLHSQTVAPGLARRLPAREDPVVGALQYLPTTPALEPVRETVRAWRPAPFEAALLHGDFWPGNIIWHHQRIAAVIDWEDAAVGSALSDLAACRAELMVAWGEEAMETFTQRYLAGSNRDTADLDLWEVYVSSAALATMVDWGLPADVERARRIATEAFLDAAIARLCQ